MPCKEAPLKKFLRNDLGQLRNGWWVAIFIAVFLASQLAYHPVSTWLQHVGADRSSLSPLPVVFLLAVTWICMRLRRQPLSAVGLRLDAKWLRQALYGIAFGSVQMLVVTALIYAVGGVRFSLDPAHGLAKTCSYASVTAVAPAARPKTATASAWTPCAGEGAICQLSGTNRVRYGTETENVTKVFTGPVTCSNAAFGDPAHGSLKTCSFRVGR